MEELDEYCEDEEDLEDVDDELEEDAEDSLKDLLRRMAEEEGYNLALSQEEYEEFLDKAYAECLDDYVSLAYEYNDIEEVEEDDELQEQIRITFSQLEDDREEYLKVKKEEKTDSGRYSEETEDREEEGFDPKPVLGFPGMLVPQEERPSRSRSGYLEKDSSVYYNGSDRIGSARRSLFDDDVVKYYDHEGKPIGYSMPSLLEEDRTDYYVKGEKAGYSRPSLIYKDVTNYYDKKGKYLGCSQKSLLDEDFENYYWKKK